MNSLDPRLQSVTLARIKELREELDHHRMMASTAESKIALLVRTWQLCPVVDRSGFCCNDPLDCQGPQP